MPKLLAGDIGWLGAGWLFASMVGALVRIAVQAAARRASTRCRLRPMRPSLTRVAARGGRLAVAALLALLLALIVADAADVAHAAATLAGAVCGAWLVRRRRAVAGPGPRVVATIGCVLGAAAVAGGFALDLLRPQHGVLPRGALYVAVALGAWVFAASASAWFIRVAGGPAGTRRPRRPVRCARACAAFDDWLAYALALTLCVVLACGFVAAGASAQLHLSALVAACGLTSALGVRTMNGVRFPAPTRGALATAGRAVVARADAGQFARATLVRVPEACVVAACSGETFDAACLLAPGDAAARRDGLRTGAPPPPAMRRRRRGRYGHAARAGRARVH